MLGTGAEHARGVRSMLVVSKTPLVQIAKSIEDLIASAGRTNFDHDAMRLRC